MVVQNPYDMGYHGVRLMKALAQDDQKTIKQMLPRLGEPDGDLFDTGIKVVVPDDHTPLKAETFDNKEKNVKGYKLGEFNEWPQEVRPERLMSDPASASPTTAPGLVRAGSRLLRVCRAARNGASGCRPS